MRVLQAQLVSPPRYGHHNIRDRAFDLQRRQGRLGCTFRSSLAIYLYATDPVFPSSVSRYVFRLCQEGCRTSKPLVRSPTISYSVPYSPTTSTAFPDTARLFKLPSPVKLRAPQITTLPFQHQPTVFLRTAKLHLHHCD